ncbi:MAG: hypothetical protein IPO69_20440 [Saprospiraceae bacterium]|nr:hypothetical protein [Saprospiraceae bacterium]
MKIFAFPIEINQQKMIGLRTERFDQECNALIRKKYPTVTGACEQKLVHPYDIKIWQQCLSSLNQYQIIKTNGQTFHQKKVCLFTRSSPAEYDRYYTQLYVLRYSLNTIKTYCNSFRYFLYHCISLHPKDWALEDFKGWIRTQLDKNKRSEAYQNTIINALKFYFEKIRHEPRAFWEIRPRKGFKLPGTLSQEEVTALINANTNLKHKSILSMIYACGLRISEVVHLRKQMWTGIKIDYLLKLEKAKKTGTCFFLSNSKLF